MAYTLDSKTRRLTASAVSAALIFVVTWTVKIPVPVSGGAYLNFGDTVIYVCSFVLGLPGAALSAGIGSVLADIAGGAAVYALPTFIIKALMGFIAAAMTTSRRFLSYLAACAVSGACMVAGYAVFEWLFFGAATAAAALPFNLLQWGAGVAAAAVLYNAANRLSRVLGLRPLNGAVPQTGRH